MLWFSAIVFAVLFGLTLYVVLCLPKPTREEQEEIDRDMRDLQM